MDTKESMRRARQAGNKIMARNAQQEPMADPAIDGRTVEPDSDLPASRIVHTEIGPLTMKNADQWAALEAQLARQAAQIHRQDQKIADLEAELARYKAAEGDPE